ncbi:MAG TPA: EAL domain-containing protein [Candidatus Limnocylindrales bacterium]|nr:EAL domain-containing protein [Candidatus Limnocylindrales bacterium]
MHAAVRHDYTPLSDRMNALLGLRVVMAGFVLVWAWVRPDVSAVPLDAVAALSFAYVAASLALEASRRRSGRRGLSVITGLLLADGVYLIGAMYLTGGMGSPIRFLVYLHLVAVSLLASYRTGLKLAFWDSLLLLVVLYAQAAQLMPAVDVAPGQAIEFEQMPIANLISFWLFALATSVFSAMNERELRQRRADLQALVDVGARLDDVTDPVRQSNLVLAGLVDRFAFPRGVVLGSVDDRMVILASSGVEAPPTATAIPDAIVARALSGRETIAVRSMDPALDPFLTSVMPDAVNLLVAPMVADGRAVGAIVVEHPSRVLRRVDRRVTTVLEPMCAMAALNLRNAVLLRHVQDLAERDALTGAANRRTFQMHLENVLDGRELRDRESITAVLFIDLDDFKVVNDTLGHAAGDGLLQAVTERLTESVRDGDLVARLGGDEFAILTTDAPDLKRSLAMAERLTRELRAPYMIGEKTVTVSASIGIASARDTTESAADVVRNADVAMYMAKANGKAGFAVFDPGMHAAIRERHEMGVQLQHAVELGQLRLAYQPIVDLADGNLVGIEALVRWQHPDRGVVSPGEFIEIAEENGAILPIGRWILREACREAMSWPNMDRSAFLCVNVSAREIQQPGFVTAVREALGEAGMAASRLSLEITETALLRATPKTIGTLESLRQLGLHIVIDDFGTGYFSLSHLRQFPVDVLKIASEFVQVPDSDAKTAALAGAIVAMGRSLEIRTVAEGIETAEQADRMRALGCAYGQGFHFAQPIPGNEVAAGAFDALMDTDRLATDAIVEAPPPPAFRAPFGGFSRRRAAVRTDATSA